MTSTAGFPIVAALLVGALLAGCSGGMTASATVAINPAKQYQRIAGFGVSEGFGQAKTLLNTPASVQKQVLSLLYSPTRGAGLTILRDEISADKGFTIEPKAPSSPNGKPSYLTLAEVDQDQGQLWFAKQIKADYGVSDMFADAWSAPAFMKTNNSAINGGTVCGVPGASCKSGDWRQAYADYLVQYAKDYAAAGVPLTYVGPENEANLSVPQDSMIMSPAQTANFMAILGATLARSGLSTRAECCATISWNYAQKYAARDRDRQTSEHGNGAVHQPRLLRRAQLAAARLEQAGLGDRVGAVRLAAVGPGLGRRLTVVRIHLGTEHLQGLDRSEPGRVPLPVGRKHELTPDRPQHGTG